MPTLSEKILPMMLIQYIEYYVMVDDEMRNSKSDTPMNLHKMLLFSFGKHIFLGPFLVILVN